MPLTNLVSNSLIFGAILSGLLGAIMFISMLLAPDLWVHGYPPDIRAKYGPMSARAAKLRPYIVAPFFLAMFVLPIVALLRLQTLAAMSISFVTAVASTYLLLLVFNTFDLLIADWLVFNVLQPKRIVLPGTEGMAGYRNYAFHFKGFLKGFVFCGVTAVLVSGVWELLRSFVIRT